MNHRSLFMSTMADELPRNLEQNLLISTVRNILNAEKVKLWLPPYSLENGEEPETFEVSS